MRVPDIIAEVRDGRAVMIDHEPGPVRVTGDADNVIMEFNMAYVGYETPNVHIDSMKLWSLLANHDWQFID